MTFADKVIRFNANLHFDGILPDDISIMNPFVENATALEISTRFYEKYYSDEKPRKLILGINPGRLGAGITGIPFTDTKRLESECGLPFEGVHSHELSSVFVYDLINACGGPKKFYRDFFINSVCPLGFLIEKQNGRLINFNYYDRKDLIDATLDFIKTNLKNLIDLGVDTSECFVLGNNKNYKFLSGLNEELQLFDKLIPLEHPRYVMQYKLKQKEVYLQKFKSLLYSTTPIS